MWGKTHRRFFHPDDFPLFILAIASILIHFWTNLFDGIFIDELYYITCSKHLDFGYVDHPPLVALIAAGTRFLFGESLFALRIPAAIAGALLIFLTGRLTRELGGNRYAQFLAALAVLFCPIYLGISGYYSMNSFDHLFWLLGAYFIVLTGKTERPLYWILFGITMGIGLQNKISVLFFGFGIFIGMILTPYRRWFRTPWPWMAGVVAFLIFLPHILWQIQNDWPTAEFVRNATLYKNLPMTPIQFISAQIMDMHPILFPLWLLGLMGLLFLKKGKPYRLFGWVYLTVLIVLIMKNGKTYYLAPAYTILFAAGALFLESWIETWNWKPAKATIATILVVFGTLTIPFALPILPTETYIRYSQALGIKPSSGEKKELGDLPQFFADRYGWEELAEAVAGVYHELTPSEQEECVLFGGSYGQAGAVDYYGPKYDLPGAISSHNSYYLWGPGNKSGVILIAFGVRKEDLEENFLDIRKAAVFDHEYKMPYQRHMPIYICRQPKLTLQEKWPFIKNFI